MSTYKLGFHCYKPLVWCGHKHTVNAFFLCKNTSVWPTRGEFSVITGGPLREERAVDGKLKSHLEWPKSIHQPSRKKIKHSQNER